MRLHPIATSVVLATLLLATSGIPVARAGPVACKTNGDGFTLFAPDFADPAYKNVLQVCPAHESNFQPKGMKTNGPLYIVIHNTGNATFQALEGNLRVVFQEDHTTCDTCKAGAHYMVGYDDDGEDVIRVIQIVSEKDAAYHAGANNIALDRIPINNSNSIGIEIVGIGNWDGWPTPELYQAVADLVKDIVRRAKADGRTIELTRDYIVGHEEVNKGGKFDPGPQWDWQLFMERYLGGTYAPAIQLTAAHAADSNDVALRVLARSNGRSGFKIERSEDEGPYHFILQPVAQAAKDATTNPMAVDLGTDRPGPLQRPALYCYRVFAYAKREAEKGIFPEVNYVNPSTDACVVVGPPGTPSDHPRRDSAIVSQSEYPIVKPGEAVTLKFTLRNTGVLSWETDKRYALVNTGGESFGLMTQKPVPNRVQAYEEITWELPFTAPNKTGAYETRWQMALVDPETHKVVALFGKEVGYVVTVVPGGNSSDLGQIIRQIIDQALKTATEPVERFVADLRRRIGEEIDRRTPWWVKCWLSLVGPGVVAPGFALWRQRTQKGRT